MPTLENLFRDGLDGVGVSTLRELFSVDPSGMKKVDDEGSLLHRAARDSSLAVVKFLVQEVGIDINVENSDGESCISIAHEENKWDIVVYLAKRGSLYSEDFCKYQLKVTLLKSMWMDDDVDPTDIWRRIIVPGFYSLRELHCAIQGAMGWYNCHLHEFELPDGNRVEMTEEGGTEEEVSVAEIFGSFKSIKYVYDFGDDWEHLIECEDVMANADGCCSAICTGGEKACPPEDVGGVIGYEDLLRVLDNPRDKEHAEMKEWLRFIGRSDFDRERFDIPPPERLSSEFIETPQRSFAH